MKNRINKTGWNDVPDGRKAVCALTPEERIAGLAGQNLMFVTHSLGSKILMDTLTAEADEVASVENRAGRLAAVRPLRIQSSPSYSADSAALQVDR